VVRLARELQQVFPDRRIFPSSVAPAGRAAGGSRLLSVAGRFYLPMDWRGAVGAALRVFCRADVKGTIREAEDVAAVHSGQSDTCPSASSGQRFYRTKTLPLGKLGTKFSKNENLGGGGSCRHPVPVLSAVEGNPRPTLPSWRGSTVSIGSRAFARKRAIRASPSKPIQRAGVWPSTRLPFPGYVPGSGAAGLLPPRRRKNHPRSGGCSSSAQRSVRDVPLGKLGTTFLQN
jgi:hypothetical protein